MSYRSNPPQVLIPSSFNDMKVDQQVNQQVTLNQQVNQQKGKRQRFKKLVLKSIIAYALFCVASDFLLDDSSLTRFLEETGDGNSTDPYYGYGYGNETNSTISPNATLAPSSAPSASPTPKPSSSPSDSPSSGPTEVQCEWKKPQHYFPNIDWYRTVIAGFPNGDKRITFLQYEGLTGWAARDSWAYETFGMSNHPFIKTNYPHHDGTWGWSDLADQAVLVVRNVRSALVEYHSVIWDLQYGNSYTDVLRFQHNLYWQRPPEELFLAWRDNEVTNEIHWWSWFIDYWMEGGLLRDIVTHQVTTQDHWNILTDRFSTLSLAERSYATVVGDAVVTPTYDPNCIYKMTDGCQPKAIISAERLTSTAAGPYEVQKVGNSIANSPGIKDFLPPQEEWACIWKEIIINKRGVRTSLERGGAAVDYNFSPEMLTEMISETTRLITKYSGAEWSSNTQAAHLVFYLNEYLSSLNQELSEVQSGVRRLTNSDFLGAETRRKMFEEQQANINGNNNLLKPQYLLRGNQKTERKLSLDNVNGNGNGVDYTEYFRELGAMLKERRTNQLLEQIEGEEKRRLQSEREHR